MPLKQQILDDTKTAMKAKEMDRVTTLRFLQSAIKNKEIEIRPQELTDDDVIAVLRKSVKQRQDSIEQYTNAGRTDLADKEKVELAIIEGYLPKQLSSDVIETFVKEAISESGASSMKDMGNVMKLVMAKTQGAADNKIVSELVKKSLQ